MTVFNSDSILIEEFLGRLESAYDRAYSGIQPLYRDTIRCAGAMAMEIIANSDSLYHDTEHSMMVTVVGQEILRGKALRDGSVSARDWLHFAVSLLCHDIGYVRGVCPGDQGNLAVIDEQGNTVTMPAGATGAFLTPYHVERGKLFVRWRFADNPVIDEEVVAKNIERTRFPVPETGDSLKNDDYPGLVRAADLIGQMADPDYLHKLAALFYEFEETGASEKMGYKTPADLREDYPNFYWKMVDKHITVALDYLQVTREGRQWVASLYSHIFSEEYRELL